MKWLFFRRLRVAELIRGILISADDFQVEDVCRAMREAHGAAIGALVTFTGLVRERTLSTTDPNRDATADSSEVATLTLEHYPGMTEASIEKILDTAASRWPLLEIQVIHRVGTLAPADQIVLVAVASAHRDAAFAAAEFVMDYLKTDAVFWKKEQTAQRTHWVQSTRNDHERALKWRDKNDSA